MVRHGLRLEGSVLPLRARGAQRSINQSIKKIIPHQLQSSTTYSRHQGSNVERGKLKFNTYKTLSPIINYS